MSTYTILDRLIHKPIQVSLSDEQASHIHHGDMIIYTDEEGKYQSGEFLGYNAGEGKPGTFISALTQEQKEKCITLQTQADEYFELFKKEFGSAFPTSKPICARMHFEGKMIYFYFFSETRYNFSEFVKKFRSMLPFRFFLYQVGPRDRVRLHPQHNEWFDNSGLPLMYSIFKHPLPNVENDAVMIQGLAGRDSESLKDRSGKFDHTLNFEKDRYAEQSNQYPRRGEIIDRYGVKMKCMGCNMLTQEIKLKGQGNQKHEGFSGEWKVVEHEEYLKCIKKNTQKNL